MEEVRNWLLTLTESRIAVNHVGHIRMEHIILISLFRIGDGYTQRHRQTATETNIDIDQHKCRQTPIQKNCIDK